jgi:hypothetical protein
MPRGLRVLEFGGGISSRWWAERGRVTTVEHNGEWAAKIREMAPSATVLHRETEGEYCVMPDGQFDVVVVDGEWREACWQKVLHARPPWIIRDDVHDYLDRVVGEARHAGYLVIPFWGHNESCWRPVCTLVAMRAEGTAQPNNSVRAALYPRRQG